jgi:predicted acylesterase/phospholipase RssA
MQPPVQRYGTLEFGKFDEVYEVGYQYCKEFLKILKREGKYESLLGGNVKTSGARKRGGPRLSRRQSI